MDFRTCLICKRKEPFKGDERFYYALYCSHCKGCPLSFEYDSKCNTCDRYCHEVYYCREHAPKEIFCECCGEIDQIHQLCSCIDCKRLSCENHLSFINGPPENRKDVSPICFECQRKVVEEHVNMLRLCKSANKVTISE